MSGKGSAPRPYSVSADEFAQSWERIFRKDKEGQGESQPDSEHGSDKEPRGQAD